MEFDIIAKPGFIQAVDSTAMIFEVPKNGALHRSMCDSRRHHHITLWCQANNPLSKVFRLDGIGSIGLVSATSCEEKSSKVIFRFTALRVRTEDIQASLCQVNWITLENS